MKMKEAEARTGLDRKNIRYYESEGLLSPERTDGNRYRDYSEEDIERLLEIRVLRHLGISIKDIRGYFEGMISLGALMEIRRGQIDSEMAQLKRLEQMCIRLEGQESLKPVTVEGCLEEIARESQRGSWFEDIKKDWKMYQKELHSQFICFEPEGEITTPADFAVETALFAARKHMDYETVKLESTYALVRLEGIMYQASFTYGPRFRYARLPLVKLVRCTPVPGYVSPRKYLLFRLMPVLIMCAGILFCVIDSQIGGGNAGMYRGIIVGCILASILIRAIDGNVHYL